MGLEFFHLPEDDDEDEGRVEFEADPSTESDYQQIEGPAPSAVPCHFCRAFHMFAGVEHDCPCHKGEMTFCIPSVRLRPEAYPETLRVWGAMEPALLEQNPFHRYMAVDIEFTLQELPSRNGFEVTGLLSYS